MANYNDLFITAEIEDGFDERADICKEHLTKDCLDCLNESLPPHLQQMIADYEAKKEDK